MVKIKVMAQQDIEVELPFYSQAGTSMTKHYADTSYQIVEKPLRGEHPTPARGQMLLSVQPGISAFAFRGADLLSTPEQQAALKKEFEDKFAEFNKQVVRE